MKKRTPSAPAVDNGNELVYVAPSAIHGFGLFARCRLPRNTLIGTYFGRATRRNGKYVLWIWSEESARWEGVNGTNEMRFLNHSATPNAEFDGLELYALRKIDKDEEITFDYQWGP